MGEKFDFSSPVSVVQIDRVLFHSRNIEQHFLTNGVAFSPTSTRLGESIKTCVQVNVFFLTDKNREQVQQQRKTGYIIVLQVYTWIAMSDHVGSIGSIPPTIIQNLFFRK